MEKKQQSAIRHRMQIMRVGNVELTYSSSSESWID